MVGATVCKEIGDGKCSKVQSVVLEEQFFFNKITPKKYFSRKTENHVEISRNMVRF